MYIFFYPSKRFLYFFGSITITIIIIFLRVLRENKQKPRSALMRESTGALKNSRRYAVVYNDDEE